MRNVVITQYVTERVDHESGRNRIHKHSKSIIHCSNAREAAEIASAIRKVRDHNSCANSFRETLEGVQVHDQNGKVVTFSRDYLEQVLSYLTEPEFKAAAE